MYQVSDAFKTAMKKPVQHFRLRGYFLIGRQRIGFTEKNIAQGSFGISNQCSGEENVEIGTVYTAELNGVFVGMTERLPRYGLKDAKIVPSVELLTSEGWEGVPLGVYHIDSGEANWSLEGIEITAYDGMSLFDKNLGLESSQGTIFDFLSLACRACGVELGMTRSEVQGLPNGSVNLAVYEENDIETWRDLIAWCAQTTGTFATMSREDKLVLRRYTQTPVDSIDASHRYAGAKFSDFETRYTGVSMVQISEGVTKYYGLEDDNGLTYNLGQNPLVQYGLEETLTAQRRAILDALSVISFVPFEVSMVGSMAYDLGDVLVFSEGRADGDKLSCITKYDWTYNGDYTVTGVGKNPALANARSKVDKNIAGLLSQTSQDVIHYYDYLNAVPYHIGDGEEADIIDFRYVTTKATHIDFHAEIKYTLETTEIEDEEGFTDTDGILRVTYILNDEEVAEYHPIDTRQDGTHLLHLVYTWRSSANLIGTFVVRLELLGGSVDIDVANARAYIAGQGIVGDDAWDGAVHITEKVIPIDVYEWLVGRIDERVSTVFSEARDYAPSDRIAGVDLMSYLVGSFVDKLPPMQRLHRFDVPYAAGVMAYDGVEAVGNVWQLSGGRSQGSVTTPAAAVDRVIRVTSRHSGDDVAYVVSFDAGRSWWTYTDDWREPDYTQDVYGMFEGTMRSISEASWAEKLNGSIMVKAILVEKATVTDIQIYTEELHT